MNKQFLMDKVDMSEISKLPILARNQIGKIKNNFFPKNNSRSGNFSVPIQSNWTLCILLHSYTAPILYPDFEYTRLAKTHAQS